VELHGNLGQGARNRNLEAFHSGRAGTLVATDVAARGIHVDDVARVVHADLPAEHKSYLHRSGRTARAGNAGTVITLITRDQVREAKALARAAGITPTTTLVDGAGHPVLRELAPGERIRSAVPQSDVPAPPVSRPARDSRGGGRNRRRGRSQSRQSSGRPASQPAAAPASRSRRRRGGAAASTSSGGHSAAAFSASRR
jgi:superfamily II DNA/RNA helicase